MGNAVNNCKYSWYSFLPLVLFNQFKFFFNMFFLLIALSQVVPGLRVGFLISFVGPLVFVLGVTLVKEFLDDHSRAKKDSQINNNKYLTVKLGGGLLQKTAAKNLKVGDIVVLNSNEAAPADLCLLWTSDP